MEFAPQHRDTTLLIVSVTLLAATTKFGTLPSAPAAAYLDIISLEEYAAHVIAKLKSMTRKPNAANVLTATQELVAKVAMECADLLAQ